MNRKIFTGEQIKELSANPNVVRCSEKSITYSKEFKIKAVKLYNMQGLGPTEIFRQAGFDLNLIGKQKPKSLMRDWNKVYKARGERGLSEARGKNGKGKGGRPKTKNLTDAEKIEYLEAKVSYLKAENDFLAKLRGKS